jgi:hypothetical protein
MQSDFDTAADEFCNASNAAWHAMDLRSFKGSINLFEYDPLIAVEWTDSHTLPMIAGVRRKNMSFATVAELLHTPSAIRGMLVYDLLMAKYTRRGRELYEQIFSFYDGVLKAICLEDPYAYRLKNIVHAEEDIQKYIARCATASPAIGRSLGKLSNACYSLSHGLYSDMHPQLVYENFGPYYQPNGNLFALKVFHNLRPTELWPETQSLPVDSIQIGVLMEGVTMSVDVVTHAIYTGSQVDGLRGWWCEMDGKPVDVARIDEVRLQIEAMAIGIYQKFKTYNLDHLKELHVHQKAWGYKKLFDALALDWSPDQSVIDAMRNKPLFDAWASDPDTGALACEVRELVDPRIEIPAVAFKK